MTFSLSDVDLATAALRPFEGADVTGLPGKDLLRMQRLGAELVRSVQLAMAASAGEIARRSTAEDGPSGLARQQGFATPEQLVASLVGGPRSDGARLVAAGRVLQEDRHPAIAQGLRDGRLTLAKAELITSAVEGLTGDTAELEDKLTRIGRVHDFERLRTACRGEAARHDALQLEGRERRQFEARSLELTEDGTGMTHVRGRVGPTYAIAMRTYLDAQVKAAFEARRGGPEDARTAAQIRADALMALMLHGLDCESPATGVKATIIVRIDKDDLERDVGFATCDAIATPISLRALRQVAVDASILPVVMNGKSQVLDLGREQRLFSWHQRMALAERDGGCVRCQAPISHCVTHHIRWWSRGGTTDLRNGVLLCTRCHTQLHHDGWEIEVDDENNVWLIAPAHLDPERTRSLGGPTRLLV